MRRNGQKQKGTQTSRKVRGVAAIEFAIVLPLLILVFTGMIEYGRMMWHYDALAKATRDAARHLSMVPVNGLADEKNIDPSLTCISPPPGSVTGRIVLCAAKSAGVVGLTPGNIDVSTTSSRVTVAINYPFTIGGWVPVIGPLSSYMFEVELSPHTTMPYMR